MGRGEISWKGQTPEGLKRQIYAKRVAKEWKFYARQRRYDRWVPLVDPVLEDWLELLDGVQRRVARRLMRPEEEPRLKEAILELFPDTEL